MAKIIAYIRTSTNRQDLGLEFQLSEVSKFKPDRIYKEQASGRKEDRPELINALAALEAGDTLLVYKLDRLGRSVKQLVNIVAELEERGAFFKSIHDNIDTTSINGRFMFTIMSAVAELEAGLISERTKDALKMTDKKLGRPTKLSDKQKANLMKAYQSAKVPVNTLAKRYGVSRSYVYSLVKETGTTRNTAQLDVAHW